MISDRERRMLARERGRWAAGDVYVAGIDEAGRGPLAGPVVAAAVVVMPGFFVPEIDDSKRLSRSQREALFPLIIERAHCVGTGIVDNHVIDQMNILNATFQAMQLAVKALRVKPDHLLVDGNRFSAGGAGSPLRDIPYTTVVGGDARCFSIAAASIVAKVTRDRIMAGLDSKYPGYGFARHMGYGTREHREAIMRLGYCEIHRRTFRINRQTELFR